MIFMWKSLLKVCARLAKCGILQRLQERKDRTILCACPGTELHEMGSRMVADLFENNGWDSIYLGATVPEDALLDSILQNTPDLVALSVTMPQHLITCKEITASIRQEFPDLKIAVGGKAFESTHNRPFSGNIKNGFLQSGTYRL